MQIQPNTEILDYSRLLPNDWAYETKKSAPLALNGQVVGGFKHRTGNKSDFALIGGLTYNSSFKLSIFHGMISLQMELLNMNISIHSTATTFYGVDC
jgi:hypothetical protein